MVNLEVWVPPEINTMHLLHVYHVRECGRIAPPGRFGWFIPIQVSDPVKRYRNYWTPESYDLHWTLFRDPGAVKVFSFTDMKFLDKYSYQDYTTSE